MFGLGMTEILIIILAIVLLILGPKKLPQLFRAMGKSIGEFKEGLAESKKKTPEKKGKK
ncbi:twin-arginine translocase TatA/TatE family subunit [Candidatus Woesearchaeota archaeon]|nr:twin-arginine translocase TatA/TatE family subunit [Candidatus Woesearchaeota archaeon]